MEPVPVLAHRSAYDCRARREQTPLTQAARTRVTAATKTSPETTARGWNRVRPEAVRPVNQRDSPDGPGLRALFVAPARAWLRSSAPARGVRAAQRDSQNSRPCRAAPRDCGP